jgi:hypothetical protein
VSGIVKVEPPLLKSSDFSLLLKTRHIFTRKGNKENLFSLVKQKWNYFSTHETTSKQQERRKGAGVL